MKNVLLELTRILENSGLAETPSSQIQSIVDSISMVVQVDVCSLYRANAEKDMVLMASHGLNTNQPIIIPAGKGLVGIVARDRHVLNVADVSQQPAFYYVPQANEDRFLSFCGVPLVRRGKVIGVLVVQSQKPARLGSEQEAFLSTLAAHLTLLVENLPLNIADTVVTNSRVEGVSGAAGVAIGKVHFRKGPLLQDVLDQSGGVIDTELENWLKLRSATLAQLEAEQSSLDFELEAELSGVFDAYKMLLADPALHKHVEQEINAGFSVPTALRKSIHYFVELFRSMQDPYLRARNEDIQHLGNKLYQVWIGEIESPILHKAGDEPFILVGSQIGVSDIASLPTGKLAGIVCLDGAALSHIAVFASALGIPAVMGVGEIKDLTEESTLIVDGFTGVVIHQPTEPVLAEYRGLLASGAEFDKRLQELHDLPAISLDDIRIRLLVNSGLQADLMPGIRQGAEGIGLYRTEIPFMVRQSLPSEAHQLSLYRNVCSAYEGKPIYIRTLDIGSDKPLPYLPFNKEENPALGWRGIRFTLDNIQLLMTQLRAILRAAQGKPNVHVLMPMVIVTSEIDRFHKLVDDACQQLSEEGIRIIRPKVGIMVEIPGALAMLPLWRKKLDFISIGSNDLGQFLLATDRNNPLVAKLYDPVHPAIVHELNRLVATAANLKLPVHLCGEMASDPVAVLLLLGMGIRSLSLSSAKLPLIKWIIRSNSIAAAQQFLAQALTLDSGLAIREMGNKLLLEAGLGQAIPYEGNYDQ